ncbi:AAA family ATPase [Hippea jasoniae]|uniref:AAA family ATPase n=1 Tax=Hippea jasoniae TaxID=944479 RepID=UPI000B2117EC|nr:AAA family ATPase [Hippea jasoniae]
MNNKHDNIIKRKLIREIRDHLNKKEITLIVGARQVGKTTLMLFLEKELKQRGKKTLYLNLDREVDKKYFTSQENLINKIRLEIGNQKGFVFIDEIQRKENAGLFLKGVFDYNLPYKFIISGSGSLELKEKIHESLIGRKRTFELNPVSFEEFINFKTHYRYENNLKDFFSIET